MEQYAMGNGHVDLAHSLGIEHAESIAVGGSCNSRIIRTTLKHSYESTSKNFYIIGITFLSRTELPVLSYDPKRNLDFEGKWLSIQNSFADSNTGIKGYMSKYDRDFDDIISENHIKEFIELKLRFEHASVLDRLDDLQFRILSMINDLRARGHGVLVYNQADDIFFNELNSNRLVHLKHKCIIQGLHWRAVPWQKYNGTPMTDDKFERGVPEEIRHPQVGAHHNLNQFLSDYITEHQLLDQH